METQVLPKEGTRVLLVADPGLPADVARRITPDLPWDVSVSERRLPADEDGTLLLPEDIDRADAELVVLLTDQSHADEVGPIVARALSTDGVGMVSLPALGALRLHSRVTAAVGGVVHELAGAAGTNPLEPFSRRGDDGVRFVAEGRRGWLRLLVGMVRANRPWRLLPHLSKAFAAALAVLAYALLNPTIWSLAHELGAWRMTIAMLLAMTIMVAWLIIDHEMWEQPKDPAERGRAARYNAATVLTLFIGVLFLYVGLLVVGFAAERIVLDHGLLAKETGTKGTLAHQLALVWLVATFATVAGAVGTGFESREAVRQAAYGHRQRERLERQDHERAADA
jgi:hypothetical protein